MVSKLLIAGTLLIIQQSGCDASAEHLAIAQKKPVSKGVFVKYFNNTGLELHQLTIGNDELGILPKDSSTAWIHYDEYPLDSGYPDIRAVARAVGHKFQDNSENHWCATQKYSVREGVYEVSITAIGDSTNNYLVLDFRCKK
jgi:hypothetical protein